MKRSTFLAGVAAAGLCLSAAPARAQVATIDTAAIAQLLNQLQQLKQQYQAQLGIFGSLVRDLDPNAYAQELLAALNPMPGAPQIAGMISGSGSFGSLAGAAGQFLRSNTYYMPQPTGPDDFNATLLQRAVNTMAGAQAMAQQSLASIQAHIAGLGEIQSQLSVASTAADIGAVNGRLQAEQANLAAQGVQAQSLSTMAAMQAQQYQQIQAQKQRQDADNLLASVSGGGGSASTLLASSQIPTFTTNGQ